MNKTTISGDFVAFTSLLNTNKKTIEKQTKKLITILQKKYNSFCRVVKGDHLECVINNSEQALQIALLIKCFTKSIHLKKESKNKRTKYFKNYGIRLAIGYGELKRFNKTKGIIDGEAIYLSGRKINEESTHNKERIVIKNTLFFVSKDEQLNFKFEAIVTLLDFILNKATSKQCEVVYYKLLGKSEIEIAKIMNISQPVVNQHSKSVGWHAIEKTINYYAQTIKMI